MKTNHRFRLIYCVFLSLTLSLSSFIYCFAEPDQTTGTGDVPNTEVPQVVVPEQSEEDSESTKENETDQSKTVDMSLNVDLDKLKENLKGAGTLLQTTTTDDKLFFTVSSSDGNVFYIIIDESQSNNNVYFLNAVTESDLISLAGDSISKSNTQTYYSDNSSSDLTKEENTVSDKDKNHNSNNTSDIITYIIVGIAAVGFVIFLYLKKFRKKDEFKEDFDDFFDDEDIVPDNIDVELESDDEDTQI